MIAALALIASVSYAFPPTKPGKGAGSPFDLPDCFSDYPRVPDPSYPVRLNENGTIDVNGTAFWYLTLNPTRLPWFMNYPIVSFHGVNFTFTLTSQDWPLGRDNHQFGSTTNGTLVPVTIVGFHIVNPTLLVARATGGSKCSYLLPSVRVSFSYGWSTTYNPAVGVSRTISVNQTTFVAKESLGFTPPTSNPWWYEDPWHMGPRVGIAYQTDGGEITLFVSSP